MLAGILNTWVFITDVRPNSPDGDNNKVILMKPKRNNELTGTVRGKTSPHLMTFIYAICWPRPGVLPGINSSRPQSGSVFAPVP